jgi:hypothetical protein
MTLSAQPIAAGQGGAADSHRAAFLLNPNSRSGDRYFNPTSQMPLMRRASRPGCRRERQEENAEIGFVTDHRRRARELGGTRPRCGEPCCGETLRSSRIAPLAPPRTSVSIRIKSAADRTTTKDRNPATLPLDVASRSTSLRSFTDVDPGAGRDPIRQRRGIGGMGLGLRRDPEARTVLSLVEQDGNHLRRRCTVRVRCG